MSDAKENNQITEIWDAENLKVLEYDIKNRLVFTKAAMETVPQAPGATGKPITGYRISLKSRNPDGTVGDLIFQTDECFSFGVSESHDTKTNELNGYSLPVCMWNQEGPTECQAYLTKLCEDILEETKDHLIKQDVKESIEQYKLERSDLKKMKIFYWKEVKGVRVPGQGPVLYAKLIVSKKKGFKILSRFYLLDQVDDKKNPIELNPYALIGKFGKTKACFKIESVYVGAQISLQVKLWEADYKPTDNALPRMGKVSSTAVVVSTTDDNPVTALMMAKKGADHSGAPAAPAPAANPDGRTDAPPAIAMDPPTTAVPATPNAVAPVKRQLRQPSA